MVNDFSQEELEANYFALCLLIPENKLRKAYYLLQGNKELVAKYFGVDVNVLNWRISFLKNEPSGNSI